MIKYRVGSHWGVTIIRSEMDEAPDESGRRPGDELVATAQTAEHARQIVNALNARGGSE